ncbi:MAG: hypothetical protein FJY97_18255 [candidate division Zixibacteria bacterium]|nr:hypothetical protein [candidate division Zixibacteria bacterium]
MLSGHITTIGLDSFGFGVAGGKGIGNLIAGLATSPVSAAPDATGKLKTLSTIASYANYLHWWNKQLRSAVGFGHAQVTNVGGQTATAIHYTVSGLCNLVWNPMPGFGVGLEYLYAKRKNKNGVTARTQGFTSVSSSGSPDRHGGPVLRWRIRLPSCRPGVLEPLHQAVCRGRSPPWATGGNDLFILPQYTR